MPITELLDSDSGTPQEVATSLTDLWFINRAFGGVSTAQKLIERVVKERSATRLSLLDVASGSGEVSKELQRKLAQNGIHLEITFLDQRRSHLNGARSAVVGDALSLPFASSSFDLVSSTLFLHHLAPDRVQQCVAESLRVCRTAVLINDVIRSPIHLALVYAGLPLFRSRLTWHDAPASVRQAYTVEEMRNILQQTPATRIEIESHYLFRMGAIAWK